MGNEEYLDMAERSRGLSPEHILLIGLAIAALVSFVLIVGWNVRKLKKF